MKRSLATLLAVLGGVIVVIQPSEFNVIEPLVVSIIGGLLAGYSFLSFTGVYSGKVWGIKIKCPVMGMVLFGISIFGLIAGGYSVVYSIIASLSLMASGEFLDIVFVWVSLLVAVAVGAFVAKILMEIVTSRQKHGLCLGQLEIFKQVDENIDQATRFVVGFEGVALFSKANYCYAVYRYTDYQLGELTSPEEVGLVGTYFIQKYGKEFTFKVDMEVIPGTPGETNVSIDSNGISYTTTPGIPDQHIFRSYIFKRK